MDHVAFANRQNSPWTKRRSYVARLFWALVHVFTIYLVVSMIMNIMSTTTPKTSASPITAVQSAVTFPIHNNAPNPNDVLERVNSLRRTQGLKPVIGDARLSRLAELRAQDMVARGYYAHTDPDGDNFYDILGRQDFAPVFACENLSLESDNRSEASVHSWLTSAKGHKECMLKPEIRLAGYAAVKMYDAQVNGVSRSFYLVVAVHSTDE